MASRAAEIIRRWARALLRRLTQLAVAAVALAAIIVLGASLYLKIPLKQLLTVQGWRQLREADVSCRFNDLSDCPAEQICAFIAKDRAVCKPRYVGPTPLLRFPFAADHPAICIQGPLDLVGDHNREISLYAVDLMSANDAGPPGVVHSAIQGTAIVYRGCANKAGGDPECGRGWGNHVRVLSPDGWMVLYAHLGSIYVEDGQPVQPGEQLGLEGTSGNARDKRHLHMSVHRLEINNWLETLVSYRTQVGVVPPSIPFETQYCDPALEKDCRRVRSRAEKLPCGGNSPVKLRADWRD